MFTQMRKLVFCMVITVISIAFAACNESPIGNSGSLSRNEGMATQPPGRNTESRVLILESFLIPGEEWNIRVSDFDQMGLDAFIAVSVQVIDPMVPPNKSSEECGAIGILIDGKFKDIYAKCRAENFDAQSITLINKSGTYLSVLAEVTGISKSKQIIKNSE